MTARSLILKTLATQAPFPLVSRRNFTKMSLQSDLASMLPWEARKMFRNEIANGKCTSGYCLGYMQANVAILPIELAEDFEKFCLLNEAACPLLYFSKAGEFGAPPLAEDSDIRFGSHFSFPNI